jgi:hypothetical protein
MLTRVAQDAERALEAVEQTEGLLDDEQTKVAHDLLRELIGQDFDVDQDGVPRLHRGTRSDRVISTVDPEMRHGRKSSQTRFDGYKLAAAATNTNEPLITAVHVAPAGESDGPQAKHLIDTMAPDRIRGGFWATPRTATGRCAPNSRSEACRCSPPSRSASSTMSWASRSL